MVLLDSEPLGVMESAMLDSLGMVLAEDVVSTRDVPPFDNSAMDGFALLAQDTKGASKENPIVLPVVETIPAGAFSEMPLVGGKAMRIMTGAPLPKSTAAAAVVRFEDTKSNGETVQIFVEVAGGKNIRRQGEDIHKGKTVLERGSQIRSASVGILASLGVEKVKVYRRPIVAVIVTGDEIAELGDADSENKIINSNAYTLLCRLRETGALPIYLGIARDTREDLCGKFSEALRKADIIITSGGVSAGDYDFVENVWRDMGAQILFSEVAQRPGKPMLFGKLDNKLIFGLPGNPVSTLVSFDIYVQPAILKTLGRKDFIKRHFLAVLDEEITKEKGFSLFARGICKIKDGKLRVKTTGAQGSGILTSMLVGNCLIVLSPETTIQKIGTSVDVILLDDTFLLYDNDTNEQTFQLR